MIAAPQSLDTRPPATEALPNGPSKASMMIAAYRAARLNQRLTLRSAPLSQQDHQPAAAPDCGAARPLPDPPFGGATVEERQATDQIAARSSQPDTAPQAMMIAEPAPETASEHPEPAIVGQKAPQPAELVFGTAPTRGEPALAEIGLGPCMLLRLNQIGVRSIHDVAQAKPDDLRAALGISSRLLNVEAWIRAARHLAATGCAA